MRTLSERLSKLSKELRVEKYSINYDSFDLNDFQDMILKNPKIAETYREGTKDYPQFSELHQDVYDSLYKYTPAKIPDQRIDYEFLLNSQIMDAMLESPKYKELRHLTRLDKIHSTIGTEILGEQAKELVKDLQDQFKEALENAASALEQAEQAEQAAQSENDNESNKDGTEVSQQNQITLEEAQKKLEEAMAELKNTVDKKARRQIQKGFERAISETKATSDMISNWGLEQDPNFTQTGYQEKMKLIEDLKSSKKLKQIATLAGRYRRLALTSAKMKVKRGVESIYEITQGNDIGRLLPSELVKIKYQPLNPLFHKGFAERTLLQYKYSSNDKKAKGPIIVCIDSSGSMSGPPEIWAKSVALGLLDIARAQNRSMFVIHFDAGFKEYLHVNNFPKGRQYDVKEVLDMAQYFAGGGTLFEPPLDLARDKISEKGFYSRSDIIFITDGCSAIRTDWLDDFMQWKNKNNVQIFSILMDVSYNTEEPLKLFSDSVTHLKQLQRKDADKMAMTIFSQF